MVLAFLSTAIVLGSVAVALRSLSQGAPTRAVTRLPDVLLGSEPTVRLPSPSASPVAEALPLPTASATPAPGPRSTPSTPSSKTVVAAPSPSQVPGMLVSISGSVTGRGSNTTLTYEVTIKNSGDTALRAFGVSAHVPAGTQWMAGGGCNGGRPFKVRSSSTERVECSSGPAISGTDDPTVHGFSIQIADELPVGGSLTVVFDLNVARDAPQEVSNHAHVTSGTLRSDSSTVTVRTA